MQVLITGKPSFEASDEVQSVEIVGNDGAAQVTVTTGANWTFADTLGEVKFSSSMKRPYIFTSFYEVEHRLIVISQDENGFKVGSMNRDGDLTPQTGYQFVYEIAEVQEPAETA